MTTTRLTAEECEQYQRDGYVVPAFKLGDEWMERLRAALTHVEQAHPEVGLDFVPSPHVPGYVPELTEYEEWLAFAGIPEVLDAVGQLIGPDFLMWGSALFGKPGRDGKETPWHQDGEYWPIKPLRSVTVWIALDESTPENGCLQVLPGSHQTRTLYQHRRDDRSKLTLNQVLDDKRLAGVEPRPVSLEAGQISIHDLFLVHGSDANHSGRRRAGMTYRYMPTTSHFDHDWAGEMTRTMGTTDMSQRPLFLMRGVDQSGKNDFSRGHEVYKHS